MVKKYRWRGLSVNGQKKIEADLSIVDRVKRLPCGELLLIDESKCYRKLDVDGLPVEEAVFFSHRSR